MAFLGFGRSDNLYFPGCFTSSFLNNKIENYRKILKKLDIDFKIQKESICCGGFMEESGYEKELRATARNNNENFQEKGFKKIITNCPLCYNTLKDYNKLIPNWNIESEHIILTILKKLREDKSLIKNFFADPVVYYDSCYLARYSNIIQEPRELLELLGYKLQELPKNREETRCSGACGGLLITNPELANKIALKLIRTIKQRGIKKIVTADARDYHHIKENINKLNISPEELQVFEISDLICDSIGIKRE